MLWLKSSPFYAGIQERPNLEMSGRMGQTLRRLNVQKNVTKLHTLNSANLKFTEFASYLYIESLVSYSFQTLLR